MHPCVLNRNWRCTDVCGRPSYINITFGVVVERYARMVLLSILQLFLSPLFSEVDIYYFGSARWPPFWIFSKTVLLTLGHVCYIRHIYVCSG